MKIDRKQQIIIAVSAMIVVLLGAWLMARNGGGLHFPGTGVGSNVQNEGPKKLSKYIQVLSAIDKEYYSDAYFGSCVMPKIQDCTTRLKDNKPTLANTFVETMKTLVELPENEEFDNCFSDALRTCGDLAVKNRIEKSADASACDSYPEPAIRQSCYNESYPKIAIQKDNPSVCNSLTDPVNAKNCLDMYNMAKSVSTREISWCDRMSADYMLTNCKTAFYANVAKSTKDPSFCRKAPSKELVVSCIGDYMRNAGHQTVAQCKAIDEFSDLFDSARAKDVIHDQCVDSIAIKISNAFPNENIPTDSINAYKAVCSGYLVDDRKKTCLDMLDSRLKNQAMMAEAAKVAAEAAKPVTPSAASGATDIATPNTPKQ